MLAYIRHNQCRPLASATSSPTPISCLIQIFGDCIFVTLSQRGRRRVCEIGHTYMVVFCGIASEYTANSGRAKPPPPRANKYMRNVGVQMGLGLSLTAGIKKLAILTWWFFSELKPSIPGAKFELRQHGRAYFNLIERRTHPIGILRLGEPYM